MLLVKRQFVKEMEHFVNNSKKVCDRYAYYNTQGHWMTGLWRYYTQAYLERKYESQLDWWDRYIIISYHVINSLIIIIIIIITIMRFLVSQEEDYPPGSITCLLYTSRCV